MKTSEVIQAWKSILSGRRPSLAIEIRQPGLFPMRLHRLHGTGRSRKPPAWIRHYGWRRISRFSIIEPGSQEIETRSVEPI